MKESDLFEPVKLFLLDEMECSHVYGEVLGCDLLALHGSVNIIVEMKMSLNFKVIEQAIDRKGLAHYIYVAVPKTKVISRVAIQLLEQQKIGLLLVENEQVRIHKPARFNRGIRRGFDIRKQIKSYHETQVGGVKSGEGVTDYSLMIENIKEFLRRKRRRGDGWVTIDEILEHCETRYANPRPSVAATLRAKWNTNWCESKTENRRNYFRIMEPSI